MGGSCSFRPSSPHAGRRRVSVIVLVAAVAKAVPLQIWAARADSRGSRGDMDRPVSVPRVAMAMEPAERLISRDRTFAQLHEALVQDVVDGNLHSLACKSVAKSLHVFLGGQGRLADADVVWTKCSNALGGVLYKMNPTLQRREGENEKFLAGLPAFQESNIELRRLSLTKDQALTLQSFLLWPTEARRGGSVLGQHCTRHARCLQQSLPVLLRLLKVGAICHVPD